MWRMKPPLLKAGNITIPKTLQAIRNSVRNPINAADFAASICSGFTDSGDKTRKSRRSGKSISHSKIETAAITTNENITKKYWSPTATHGGRGKDHRGSGY